jgi:hypothetical protein
MASEQSILRQTASTPVSSPDVHVNKNAVAGGGGDEYLILRRKKTGNVLFPPLQLPLLTKVFQYAIFVKSYTHT